jgi:hypothetical protein
MIHQLFLTVGFIAIILGPAILAEFVDLIAKCLSNCNLNRPFSPGRFVLLHPSPSRSLPS